MTGTRLSSLFNLSQTPPGKWAIKRLEASDHARVQRLFDSARGAHLHLDWYSLPDLLIAPELRCWVAKDGTKVRAVLGATIHHPPPNPKRDDEPVAWVRLATSPARDNPDVPNQLWPSLKADLQNKGVRQSVILTMEPWIEAAAKEWGFTPLNQVISLRREGLPLPMPTSTSSFIIREAAHADFESITEIDAAAFEPLWQYNLRTLELAQLHAATLTVLEKDKSVLGYQLSTWHIDSGHLARLAIHPDWQGQGLGGMLIESMLRFFDERDTHIITVNTQLDNLTSQRLYGRYGFARINQQVSVCGIDLSK